MKISVVIPCFNERNTIREIVSRVVAQPFSMEVLVVDDASTDGSLQVIRETAQSNPVVRVLAQPQNGGKGKALRRAFAEATGDVVLVQDADLEYDPNDYGALLDPIVRGRADVVFGSRFLSGPRRVLYYWHSVGNKVLTTFSNMVTDLNLSDMETGYKVFRREIIQSIALEEDRFGIEPEIVAKVSRVPNVRIYEVPITYAGRTYADGKKIGVKDGVRAVYVVAKYGLLHRVRPAQR